MFLGQPLRIPSEDINRIVVNDSTKQMYEWATPEKKTGEMAEASLLALVSLLEVDKAYIAPCGSYADCKLKCDLIVEYQGARLGIQVKSSENAAKSHIGKHPKVGVFWKGEDNLTALIQLSKWLKVPVKQEVKETVALWQKLRGKSLPQTHVENLGSFKLLQQLALIKRDKANWKFL